MYCYVTNEFANRSKLYLTDSDLQKKKRNLYRTSVRPENNIRHADRFYK